MRRTKIVCTLGPASDTKEILIGLCRAGMNVARLNFSHGVHADHQKRIDMVKEVRDELGLPIAILLDTKGPEYRIKTFENDSITLADGDTFTFTTDAGGLEYLNGKSFQVQEVDFVSEYFPKK